METMNLIGVAIQVADLIAGTDLNHSQQCGALKIAKELLAQKEMVRFNKELDEQYPDIGGTA